MWRRAVGWGKGVLGGEEGESSCRREDRVEGRFAAAMSVLGEGVSGACVRVAEGGVDEVEVVLWMSVCVMGWGLD